MSPGPWAALSPICKSKVRALPLSCWRTVSGPSPQSLPLPPTCAEGPPRSSTLNKFCHHLCKPHPARGMATCITEGRVTYMCCIPGSVYLSHPCAPKVLSHSSVWVLRLESEVTTAFYRSGQVMAQVTGHGSFSWPKRTRWAHQEVGRPMGHALLKLSDMTQPTAQEGCLHFCSC